MLATTPQFSDAYILEIAYWEEGMPFRMLQKYLKKKGLPGLGNPVDNPVIEKRVKKDIPVLGRRGAAHTGKNRDKYDYACRVPRMPEVYQGLPQ